MINYETNPYASWQFGICSKRKHFNSTRQLKTWKSKHKSNDNKRFKQLFDYLALTKVSLAILARLLAVSTNNIDC